MRIPSDVNFCTLPGTASFLISVTRTLPSTSTAISFGKAIAGSVYAYPPEKAPSGDSIYGPGPLV